MSVQVIFEPGDPIVSMIEWRGMVLVATTCRVYRMVHAPLHDQMVFRPVVFMPEEPIDDSRR